MKFINTKQKNKILNKKNVKTFTKNLILIFLLFFWGQDALLEGFCEEGGEIKKDNEIYFYIGVGLISVSLFVIIFMYFNNPGSSPGDGAINEPFYDPRTFGDLVNNSLALNDSLKNLLDTSHILLERVVYLENFFKKDSTVESLFLELNQSISKINSETIGINQYLSKNSWYLAEYIQKNTK